MRNLCNQAVWLERGRLEEEGTTNKIIADYTKWTSHLNNSQYTEEMKDGFLSWRIVGNDASEDNLLLADEPFTIELIVKDSKEMFNGSMIFVLQNSAAERIAGWHRPGLKLKPGLHRFLFKFPSFPIRSDIYYWNVALWDGSRKIDSRIIAPEMVVSTHDFSNLNQEMSGIVNIPCTIEVVE